MILCGKSSGKPKFGCPYCSASTPYLDDGTLYTLADLLGPFLRGLICGFLQNTIAPSRTFVVYISPLVFLSQTVILVPKEYSCEFTFRHC